MAKVGRLLIFGRLSPDVVGAVPKGFALWAEGKEKGLEVFCADELGPIEVVGLLKMLELLDCGSPPKVDVAEPSADMAGAALCDVVPPSVPRFVSWALPKLIPDPNDPPCARPPAGGGPAGVVETPLKDQPLPALLAAGVEFPAVLDIDDVAPTLPNGLALLVAAPPLETLATCADPVLGVSEGLLGVENNPKFVDLLLPPNKFVPLELSPPNTDTG